MDVNERAREEWKQRIDGFERVQRTLERTREPKSAREIATTALVSEKTVGPEHKRIPRPLRTPNPPDPRRGAYVPSTNPAPGSVVAPGSCLRRRPDRPVRRRARGILALQGGEEVNRVRPPF
jgi:hypothetical protein